MHQWKGVRLASFGLGNNTELWVEVLFFAMQLVSKLQEVLY